MRSIRDTLRAGWRILFEMGQRAGVNILPSHYYSSTPDIRSLKHRTGWRHPSDMAGVAGASIPEQVAFLAELFPPALAASISSLDLHATASAENRQNGGYGAIEADVLHAFVRRYKPRRIVQVGCGVSTSIILRAAASVAYKPDITCIEPFPSQFLRKAASEKRIRLIVQDARDVDQSVFTSLERGDLLFVDSTHTVKPGSEVNRIVLEILPRMSPGVFVHFHDIYFPYDYQRTLLSSELFFSTETTLLHAYLIDNCRYRIVLSLSMLHYSAPRAMKESIRHYDPQGNEDGLSASGGMHFPSALYLLAVDEPGGPGA